MWFRVHTGWHRAALWGVIRSCALCMEMTSKQPLGLVEFLGKSAESPHLALRVLGLGLWVWGVWVTAQRLGRVVLVVDFGDERGYCQVKSQLVGVWDWLKAVGWVLAGVSLPSASISSLMRTSLH